MKNPEVAASPFLVFQSGDGYLERLTPDHLVLGNAWAGGGNHVDALLEGGELRAFPEGSRPESPSASSDVPCTAWTFADLNAAFGNDRFVCGYFDVFQRDAATGSCTLLAEMYQGGTQRSSAELVAVTGSTISIAGGCTIDAALIEGTTGLAELLHVGDYTYTNTLGVLQAVPHLVALRAVLGPS